MIEAAPPLIQRALLFAGVVLLVGIPVWRTWIAPRLALPVPAGAGTPGAEGDASEAADLAALERRMARAGFVLTLGLLPVWGLRLYIQLRDFRDPFAPLREDLSFLVRETFWGTVWLGQGAVIVAGVAVFARLGRLERPAGDPSGFSPGWLAAWGVSLLLVLSLALSSHAMSADVSRPLAVALDTGHVLAAGAWIGTLALILVVRPTGPARGPLFASELRAFSPMAMVAVGTIVALGVGLSAVHLGELGDLWTTEYGRTLLLKVGAAGVAFGLGFVNWRSGLPVLGTPEGRRSIRRRAGLEVAAVAVVLLLTALLTGTAPPGGR